MSKKLEIEKAFLADAIAKYKARYNCKPGYKRCVNCSKVGLVDLFVNKTKWCKKCNVVRLAGYRLIREEKLFAKTGQRPHKKAGRPPGAKNKVKVQSAD